MAILTGFPPSNSISSTTYFPNCIDWEKYVAEQPPRPWNYWTYLRKKINTSWKHYVDSLLIQHTATDRISFSEFADILTNTPENRCRLMNVAIESSNAFSDKAVFYNKQSDLGVIGYKKWGAYCVFLYIQMLREICPPACIKYLRHEIDLEKRFNHKFAKDWKHNLLEELTNSS